MSNLQIRQEKIKEKVKNTSWRDFMMKICSRYPLMLYRNNKIISIYPPSSRKNNVILGTTFETSRLSGEDKYSFDFESQDVFFISLQKLFLFQEVPSFHHYYGTENVDYANHVSNTKNAYLSFHVTGGCENVLYSLGSKIHVKNIFSSVMSWIHTENVYQSLGAIESYNIYYSLCCKNCNNIWFSSDLVGCSECICCQGLENTSFHIYNQAVDKESYYQQKKELLAQKEKFDTWYSNIKPLYHNIGSTNTQGYYCSHCDMIEGGLYSHFSFNCRNIAFVGHPDGLSNAYNALFCSAGKDYYGACGVGGDSEHIYHCISVMGGFDCYYCYYLESCSFCLGCIGLKNKSYCILNKQYSKEEWYEKVPIVKSSQSKQNYINIKYET